MCMNEHMYVTVFMHVHVCLCIDVHVQASNIVRRYIKVHS